MVEIHVETRDPSSLNALLRTAAINQHGNTITMKNNSVMDVNDIANHAAISFLVSRAAGARPVRLPKVYRARCIHGHDRGPRGNSDDTGRRRGPLGSLNTICEPPLVRIRIDLSEFFTVFAGRVC